MHWLVRDRPVNAAGCLPDLAKVYGVKIIVWASSSVVDLLDWKGGVDDGTSGCVLLRVG